MKSNTKKDEIKLWRVHNDAFMIETNKKTDGLIVKMSGKKTIIIHSQPVFIKSF